MRRIRGLLSGILLALVVFGLVACSPGLRPDLDGPPGVNERNAFLGQTVLTGTATSGSTPTRTGSPGFLLENGFCPTVGDAGGSDDDDDPVLIAPRGSRVAEGGGRVEIAGVGALKWGERVPAVRFREYTVDVGDRSEAMAACTGTRFIEVFPAE